MTGWLLVLAAGIAQGGFLAPMKFIRGWNWENSWFLFACTAYLVCPWLFVGLTAPDPLGIYMQAGPGHIGIVMAMGFLWGIGALTFGLGVNALGLSVGFAVILGVASASGTLLPLLVLNQSPPKAGALVLTIFALSVMLTGVAVCSLSGRWRDARMEGPANYGRGIALCVVSGLLSSCGNVGLVLGQPIIEIAVARGVPVDFAPNLVWALLTVSLFLCNGAYSGQKLVRQKTLQLYRGPCGWQNFLLAVSMGVLWMLGFVSYGAGTRHLGAAGSSFGWSVLMGSMVITANLLGVMTGEWKEAPARSYRQLWIGVGLACLAIAGLGLANQVAQ